MSKCTQEPLLLRSLEAISEYSGRGLAWLTLGMVLMMASIVLLRYGFNTPAIMSWSPDWLIQSVNGNMIALQESVLYMHSMVFMLGAAYTLKKDQHVRVDILYRQLGPQGRAVVDLLGACLLLGPVCVFLLWVSWDYVAVSWADMEGSRETGGLPGVFLLKTVIPVMAVLLLLQGLAQVLRALRQLLGWPSLSTKPDASTS